jgi:N-acetylneuraminate synthase
LSRSEKGPDSEFSLEPQELKQLCIDTKIAWQSLGQAGYEKKEAEKSNVKYRRSIYAVKDIKKGDKLTKENIKRIRPGFGLEPKYYEQILGKIAKFDIKRGTATNWDLVNI